MINNLISIYKTHPEERLLLAAVIPLILLTGIFLYENKPIEKQQLHSSAIKHQETSIKNAIEEQNESKSIVCPLLCNEDLNIESDIRKSYCENSCNIIIKTSEDENKTVEAIKINEEIHNSAPIPHNQVGVYLTASNIGNKDNREEVIDEIKNHNANSIIFDIKNGFVYFHAYAELANEIGTVRPIYELPEIVKELRKRNIYSIGRYVVAKDPALAIRKSDTQLKDVRNGSSLGSKWIKPNNEFVLSYNEEILREIIMSGIDEINFDYIRYPTEYSSTSINLTGEQKADELMEFLRMARNLIDEHNSKTKLGVSTYAILGWDYKINLEPLGQDILRFNEVVDVISPMAYPSTFAYGYYYNPQKHDGPREYYLVKQTLEGYKKILGNNYWKLRPWIQGYYLNSNEILSEINAVYDANLCGYTVWSAGNIYDEFYKALENIKRPKKCNNRNE